MFAQAALQVGDAYPSHGHIVVISSHHGKPDDAKPAVVAFERIPSRLRVAMLMTWWLAQRRKYPRAARWPARSAPFYVPLGITLLLITYVPDITTWIPRLALGP
jgi:hypothetical protein